MHKVKKTMQRGNGRRKPPGGHGRAFFLYFRPDIAHHRPHQAVVAVQDPGLDGGDGAVAQDRGRHLQGHVKKSCRVLSERLNGRPKAGAMDTPIIFPVEDMVVNVNAVPKSTTIQVPL